MSSEAATSPAAPVSKVTVWIGRVISAVPVLMLTMSSIMKLVQPPFVMEGMSKAGYTPSGVLQLGIVELACTALYVLPQTAVLGAILLTGYLGGATATHVVAGESWFGPVGMGVLVWLGLYLRDPRLRVLTPLRTL
jgi:hypothetical protein